MLAPVETELRVAVALFTQAIHPAAAFVAIVTVFPAEDAVVVDNVPILSVFPLKAKEVHLHHLATLLRITLAPVCI
jgi:hypothetical protein